MPSFTHLHIHSEYSLLDGMCKLTELAHHTRELGMDALALTDHGVLYGAIEFYKACKDAGIKPILGVEAYVAPGDHRSRTAADRDPSHLILLAKNEAGWRNMIKLVTRGQVDGFYYKPRVDHDLLAAHAEGLVVLSGCLAAEVPKLILAGRMDEARQTARWYKDVFGDYFFELQSHAIPELDPVNKALVEMGREMDIPLVATNDSHYVRREQHYAHEVLLCIQTNATIHDEKRFKFADDSCYVKSPEEMAALFPDLPEAIANTQRVADLCDVKLDFNKLYLPQFPVPGGKSADEYLSELCWEGLHRRYPGGSEPAEQRLRYELDVIEKTKFANYFLVVWDIIRAAKERGILYGVRGSAAASIVLYTLGITEVEPLEYRLVFERFLNIERKEMPDIDMDFEDDRREELIQYVGEKYGSDHVCQIVTFGTLGAKAAVRDTARALGMSFGEGDRIARLVPSALHITLDKALEESPELSEIYRADETVRHLIDTARTLEGTARHASTHAAGVVISQEPLMGIVPLQKATRGGTDADNGTLVAQWPMGDIAKVGLLKMDFLGLINLTMLRKARDMIKQTRGIDIDFQKLPLDDKKTYDLLAAAETTGVFQLESAGMRRAVRELQPQTVAEIAALVALYRPGPMQHIPTYIANKFGRQEIRYPHEALRELLEDTYGVIVYQDQVLLILQRFAGYSLGQADIVRKAMGKKIREIMEGERAHFLEGARAKGFSEESANEVFDLIEPFAGYAFNKAHATSYALISYQTAYLKANYAPEYMSALMTCYMGNPEKLASAVAECGRLGVLVLPPDINHSDIEFKPEPIPNPAPGMQPWGVRFGLAAIKNVGVSALEGLLRPRREGPPFSSLEDLCRRADLSGVNKRALECLIKAGALDRLGKRGAMLAGIDRILAAAQREQKLKEAGQTTMFDLWGESVPVPMESLDLPGGDVPLKEKLAWEKELLGVYVSEHPFAAVAAQAARKARLCGQIDAELLGEKVTVAGMVASVRQLATKDRRTFVSAILEDLEGSVEVTAWPEVYERTRDLWLEGEVLLVTGKVSDRRGSVQITCDAADRYVMDPDAAISISSDFDDEYPPDFFLDTSVLAPQWAPSAAESPADDAAGSRPLPDEEPVLLTPAVAEAPPAEPERVPVLAAAAAPTAGRVASGNGGGNGYGVGSGPIQTVRTPRPPATVPTGYSNGNGNGNGRSGSGPNGGYGSVGSTGGGAERPAGPRRRTLSIELHESANVDRDLDTFNALVNVLKKHQGSDPVRLTVFSEGRAHPLELPGVRFCAELMDALKLVVGEGAVSALEG